MRTYRIEVIAPLLDHDLSFFQAVEYFLVEALVAQLAVEGFAIAVLPRTAGLDVQRSGAELCKPAANDLCRHFRAVIGADVFWNTSGEHHVGHRLDDAKAVDPARDADGQAFPGELIDQSHEAESAAVIGLRLDKVVAPDMIAMLRPEPDAGSIVQPEPATRLVFPGYFQPLATPDPLDAITADLPTRLGQQRRDPTIAVTPVPRRQRDNRARQRIFIGSDDGRISLRSAGLVDDPAGMTFGKTILRPNAFNSLPASLGAYKFPEATSLRTCFSSDRSATRRFRRTFSRSSSFIRFA